MKRGERGDKLLYPWIEREKEEEMRTKKSKQFTLLGHEKKMIIQNDHDDDEHQEKIQLRIFSFP